MEAKQKGKIKLVLKTTKANLEEIVLGQPIDLALWSVKEQATRCRILDSDQELTLRWERFAEIVPGEIITVHPIKCWTYAGHPYLSGRVLDSRLDIPALGLKPLGLKDGGLWNPADEYWGENGEALEDWAKPIIEFGPRPQFEMEQVIPGEDPDDPFEDPILEASELNECGDAYNARKILMDVLSQDLRCLDAHAHLGNIIFDFQPEEAIRHYEVGVRIGDITLGSGFNGVLKWGYINNRPFLRCLMGYGLCLWRLRNLSLLAKVKKMNNYS